MPIFVYGENIGNYQDLELIYNLSSNIKIKTLNSDYIIDYIQANVTFFPKANEDIKVLNKKLISQPKADIFEKDDFILFKWDKPHVKQLNYELIYDVNKNTNFKKIGNKIKFPIKIDSEFTQSSDFINSDNKEIFEQASEIVEGEDDLYEAVYKIAKWVNENIDYDLSTLTADITQDSVWVLKNREGVCDELTVLFIAMVRSLGIPAKFVSGVAYTNIGDKFGGHAWAEVYFPSEGWIPFDVTYGQYGYVDASHIKMKESIGAKDSSVSYSWKSRDVEVEPSQLSFNVSVIKTGDLFKFPIKFNIISLIDEVGPASYVPIEVSVENLEDYYISVMLYITKGPTILEDNKLSVSLKPKQKKNVFKIIKVPDDVEKGYTYTSEIEVTDGYNKDSILLTYGYKYNVYNFEDANSKIVQLNEVEGNGHSSDLYLNCDLNKEIYYTYENAFVKCDLINNGNMNLNDLAICLENTCKKIDLPLTKKGTIDFEFSLKDYNSKELAVSAKNKDIVKYAYLRLNVYESPNLRIINLSYPEELEYKKLYDLIIDLDSESVAKNVEIYINNEKIFNFDRFEGEQELVIPFYGKLFFNKEVKIKILYEDMNSRKYQVESTLDADVINVPWHIKFFSKIKYIF